MRPELLIKNPSGAVIDRIPENTDSGAIFTAGLDYSQALSSSTNLIDKALLEAGSSNTLLTNTLGLTVKLSDKLALGLAYSLQDNTKPPAGLKKLDTIETINLVYAF